MPTRGAFSFIGWPETRPLLRRAHSLFQAVRCPETRLLRSLFQAVRCPETRLLRSLFQAWGHSRTSTKWPAIAAAAAMTGDTRWVRPRKPWRPSKLRLEVEAQRSPGAR